MTPHYSITWLKERIEQGETVKFLYFWGHTNKYNEQVGKFCFSQWFNCPFTVDSVTYPTGRTLDDGSKSTPVWGQDQF